MQVLPAAERAATPWRNGGGITWPVAASPAAGADFDWRVSIAEIAADGDFSAFPGVDRTIAVIDGAGVQLVEGDREVLLAPLRPVSFSGDARTSCRLIAGRTMDLNLMCARGRAAGSMEFRSVDGSLRVTPEQPGDELIVVVIDGAVSVGEESDAVTLEHLDAVRSSDEIVLGCRQATVALIRLHTVD